MAKEGGEIRIVKKKNAGHGHHGGAWKVAYADFVTAMMAFFMVMWLIGMDAQTRAAIAAYFRDPVGFMEAVRKNEAIFSINDALPPGGKNTQNMPRAAKDGKTIVKKNRKTEQQELEEFKQYMERALSNIPELSRLKEHVKIEFVKEGLRIELLEGKEPVFFQTGSATITPAARRLLEIIAKKVGQLDNRVIVEGHTDAQPYRYGAGYSNWELSADRANAARRVLEAGGLWKGQVAEVRGYADTRLRDPMNPLHYSNRRVSLLIPYTTEATIDNVERK
ncbi:MAG: flagellar motor protein MotB [Fimbriimonadales bacterium]|nr:MAG: flagellar motor protein MotB [Fimbriimonadales bacterium]